MPDQVPSGTTLPDAAQAPEPTPGTVIGRFELLRRL
jgi:hypothetical protein